MFALANCFADKPNTPRLPAWVPPDGEGALIFLSNVHDGGFLAHWRSSVPARPPLLNYVLGRYKSVERQLLLLIIINWKVGINPPSIHLKDLQEALNRACGVSKQRMSSCPVPRTDVVPNHPQLQLRRLK